MAHPSSGLTPAKAALLLRCQQVREARLRSEAARCAAERLFATQQVETAQAAAGAHAAEEGVALRREYDRIVGSGFSLPALDALRSREGAMRDRQAILADAVSAAQEEAEQATARDAAARQSLLEAARHVARRERLLDSARSRLARTTATRDEVRSEDGHAALRTWRQ